MEISNHPTLSKLLAPKFLVGIFLPLFLVLWWLELAPQILKIPSDFSYSADVISVDNFYDESTNEFKGEQYSQTEFSYKTLSSDGGQLLIQNTFHVRTLDGETIFKAEPVYGIDAITGEHIKTLGDREREGYLFAPQFLKAEETFFYWHVDSNQATEMHFMGEETLYGLKVYRYGTDDDVVIDQTENLGFLPEVGETRGIKLITTNNLWIEPTTGYLVKQEDFSTDYYYYDLETGERIAPYNQFHNSYSEQSVQEHVEIAKTQKALALFVEWGVPCLMILSALLYLAVASGWIKPNTFIKKHSGIEILVLLVTISLTVFAYWFEVKDNAKNIDDLLSEEVQKNNQHIVESMSSYEDLLLAGRALFAASSSVERNEWSSFISSFDLSGNYPGILGLGYAKVVKPEDKNNFIASVQAEGFPAYQVFPEGSRDVYAPVLYVEPFNEENQEAFGFDMFSEETRRKAMIFAGDTGGLAASGKVALVQEENEEGQAGFLIYVPVYKNGARLETREDRQAALEGYVFSRFRMEDLMNHLLKNFSENLNVKIYDGLQTKEDSLMFDLKKELGPILFRSVDTVYIAGHPWTIEYVNSESFMDEASIKWWLALILLIGLVLSLMSYALVHSLLRAEKRAAQYAQELTKDIEGKNENLEAKVKELSLMNRTMVDRELKMVELKETIERLKKD